MTLEIKNKRSAALNSAPEPGQLTEGEIGINYNADSLALYVKDTNGNVRKIAGSGSEGQYWALSGTTLEPIVDTYNLDIGGGSIVLGADGNVAITGKATSAATASSDGATTLATKGYVDSQIGSSDDLQEVTDNGNFTTNNIEIGGTAGSPKIELTASSGNGAFDGKLTSASTVSGDADNTLTTKGYVDGVIPSDFGVTKITEGANIEVTPASGVGDVQVAVTGVLKPGDNISELTNDEGYLAPGDNVSELTNDAGYITDAGVTKLTAGAGISLDPVGGTGEVEITATGGGGGGSVDSVTGGTNINVGGTAEDPVVNLDDSIALTGKATSDATVAGDPDETLTTKGYVDSLTPGGGGVTKIVAGTNVTIDPTTGEGEVTINSTGGGTGTPTNTNLYGTAKAWANTPQVTSGTVVPIDGGMNVANIERTNQGQYTATFTTPMPNEDYSVVGTCNDNGAFQPYQNFQVTSQSASSFTFTTGTVNYTNGGMAYKDAGVNFAVFDDQPAEVALTTSGDVINYSGAAAWAQWNGQNSNGVCPLNGALNIASITRNTKGIYDVLFATPMPDANYSVQATSTTRTNQLSLIKPTGFTITFRNASDVNDASTMCLSVFATNALPPKGGTGTDAWGAVDSDGTVNASFNATVSQTVKPDGTTVSKADGTYYVTFGTPMPTANYAVVFGTDGRKQSVSTKTSAGFTVVTAATSSGTPTDSGFDFAVNCTNATLPQTVTQEMIEAAINNPGISAWGKINADASIASGLNISTVTTSTVASNIGYNVTFTTSMPSADYAVVGSAWNSNRVVVIQSQDVNGFRLELRNQSNNGVQDDFSFQVAATNALPPKGGTGTDVWAYIDADGNVINGFNIDAANTNYTGADGKYQVSFTTPMPHANYAISGSAPGGWFVSANDRTTDGFTAVLRSADATAGKQPFSIAVNATNAQLPDSFTKEEIQSVIDANPKGIAKAWINFDGTAVTAAEDMTGVRSSFNVDAVVDDGAGLYTIFFESPMPDTNYVMIGGTASTSTTGGTANSVIMETNDGDNRTVKSFQIRRNSSKGANGDNALVCCTVFST